MPKHGGDFIYAPAILSEAGADSLAKPVERRIHTNGTGDPLRHVAEGWP